MAVPTTATELLYEPHWRRFTLAILTAAETRHILVMGTSALQVGPTPADFWDSLHRAARLPP